ncbi:MAG TPA: DUF488 family protein [Gemmatimonadaceae bacterium]|nr:DUF488 family protein [Gemmatimonadaceae bacterium]
MSVSYPKSARMATPDLLDRQRRLLELLDALGGSAGRLDFQKLLFLYCQEPYGAGTYQFVPYRFGAFSFTSYADRRKLIERGLLAADDEQWQLTPQGRRTIGGTQDMMMATFADRHRHLRGDALVAETYRRFPYYAIRSEIADRVLHGERKALARIAAARPALPKSGTLSTIGYEGLTIESYLNALIGAGVTLLCDVRRNPISRKYGFAKRTLANACEGVAVRYEHLPELGIASEQRRNLATQADYDALFTEYERDYLPSQLAAVKRIASWISEGQRVALTCYERLPEQCHRHCVGEAVEKEIGAGMAASHLSA